MMEISGSHELVRALVLESTPCVLSLGVLCELSGYAFLWEGYSRAPVLTSPAGCLTPKLQVPELLARRLGRYFN